MKKITFFQAGTIEALNAAVDEFIEQNPSYIPDSSSLAWDGSAWALSMIFMVII